jgi:hypothetical protein
MYVEAPAGKPRHDERYYKGQGANLETETPTRTATARSPVGPSTRSRSRFETDLTERPARAVAHLSGSTPASTPASRRPTKTRSSGWAALVTSGARCRDTVRLV